MIMTSISDNHPDLDDDMSRFWHDHVRNFSWHHDIRMVILRISGCPGILLTCHKKFLRSSWDVSEWQSCNFPGKLQNSTFLRKVSECHFSVWHVTFLEFQEFQEFQEKLQKSVEFPNSGNSSTLVVEFWSRKSDFSTLFWNPRIP